MKRVQTQTYNSTSSYNIESNISNYWASNSFWTDPHDWSLIAVVQINTHNYSKLEEIEEYLQQLGVTEILIDPFVWVALIEKMMHHLMKDTGPMKDSLLSSAQGLSQVLSGLIERMKRTNESVTLNLFEKAATAFV